MPTLKFLATRILTYSGFDKGVAFTTQKGEQVTVSKETADRLMKDYPGDWKVIDEAEASVADTKSDESAANDEDADDDDELPDASPDTGKEPKKNKAVTRAKKKGKRRGW